MDIECANVIICESTCGCSSIHTVTAHHRNYPEIAVEAGSVARAVEHLERLLARCARLRPRLVSARGTPAGGGGCPAMRIDAPRGTGVFTRSLRRGSRARVRSA